VPQWVSYALFVVGAVAYGKIEGLAYILFSYLYTKKITNFGFASPLFRGLQSFFIVAGVTGYHSPIAYVVGGLLLLRNLAGDVRDSGKDGKEGMRTIPVIIGMKNNIKYIHLISTILTSTVWWSMSTLSIAWLLLVIVIQITTYNLTSR
jgi:1,4-dihydroxy-2-naphthoate octaprenyltransferase